MEYSPPHYLNHQNNNYQMQAVVISPKSDAFPKVDYGVMNSIPFYAGKFAFPPLITPLVGD